MGDTFSTTMERKIIIYLIFGGLIKSIAGQTPQLQIIDSDTDEGIEEGTSFTLNCTVTIDDVILFKLNNTQKATCNAPFGGSPTGCNPNTITQSIATSITSWTISSAEPSHHGYWICTLGSNDSPAEFLQLYKLPSVISSQSGISSDTIVNDTSSFPIIVDVDCMFSQNGPSMELQFVVGGISSASVKMSCTALSTACSPCTGCTAYSCQHTLKFNQGLSSGQITLDTPYTLKIKVGATGTTQTFSNAVFAPHTITFKRTSQSVSKTNKPFNKAAASQGTATAGTSGLSSVSDALTKRPRFISRVVRKWYFSSRYVVRGRVVYGIQILIVAAATQVVVIIPAVVVLVCFADQNEFCFNILLPSLILGWPAIAVALYLLYKALSGQKEWIHIEFGENQMHPSLSDDYGVKFDTINKDKIWFKVWAKGAVQMTLFRNEKEPLLDIILGYGKRTHEFDNHTPTPLILCDNVLSTDDKFRIFYLTCTEHVVTVISVLDGEEETVLEWSGTDGSERLDFGYKPLSNIMVSNYIREQQKTRKPNYILELKEKDESVETADPADTADKADTKCQTGTRGEWIFFIRQGDGLNEDDDDSCVSKTLQLMFVVVFPIAWLVLIVLFLRAEWKTKEIKNRKG